MQLVDPCRGICERLARRGDVRLDLLSIIETGNCQRWKVYGEKETAQIKLKRRHVLLFLPSFHAHGLLLEHHLLLLHARLKRRGETISTARAVRETMGNLELFRLACLVILELIHVHLKPLISGLAAACFSCAVFNAASVSAMGCLMSAACVRIYKSAQGCTRKE